MQLRLYVAVKNDNLILPDQRIPHNTIYIRTEIAQQNSLYLVTYNCLNIISSYQDCECLTQGSFLFVESRMEL
jgi:hypothetical protein